MRDRSLRLEEIPDAYARVPEPGLADTAVRCSKAELAEDRSGASFQDNGRSMLSRQGLPPELACIVGRHLLKPRYAERLHFTHEVGKQRSAVLGLIKMDWNNNTIYKKLSVTLDYSKHLADIAQQNPSIVDTVYDSGILCRLSC